MALELKNTKAELIEKLKGATSQADFAEQIVDYCDQLEAFAKEDIEQLKALQTANLDQKALEARGIKPLTTAEMEVGKDFKALAAKKLGLGEVKAALKDVHLPHETVDYIFDGITQGHELLNYIDFQNTGAATRWLFSKNAYQKAVWGAFDAEVTKELDASFTEVEMDTLSLTAFIPVSRGLLDLGPSWIYQYVVDMLRESIANGLEDGVINNLATNTGPIGMLADLTQASPGEGFVTYTAKEKEKVTKLDPATYGKLIAKMAKTNSDIARPVSDVVFICNPEDYYTKVFPAITVLGTNGSYMTYSVPFPTRFVQSAAVAKDTAILYIPNKYWLGLGTAGRAGTIEASDEYKFLERKRYYLTYLYGAGMPKDNYCCLPLDISELEPAAITVTTKAEAAE